jgi:O-acetyl-ADP-ribose deacetylase (regulator of RNase III)
MIRFVKKGSLFGSTSQTLVNPVNRVGVSGAGLAKDFKRRWPDMHKDYVEACKEKTMGALRLSWTFPHVHMVLCFVTKEHWRDPSTLELIEAGLKQFAASPWTKDGTITSIAFPALGCGNGGLDWKDVKPLMTSYLEPIDLPIEIYEPIDRAALARSRERGPYRRRT